MKVTVTNLTLSQLSTDLGLLQPGQTVSALDVSPDKCHKMAAAMKSLVDAGRITLTVTDEDSRLDALEPLMAPSPGAAVLLQADVTVTAAQMLALNATPITLVAAPGAGKALVFESAVLFLDYNSAAYAGIAAGEDLAIKYTDAAGLQLGGAETTGFLDQTADQMRYVRNTTVADAALSTLAVVANSPLVLHMLVGEVTTGDSPLKVRTYYRVVPTTL